MTEEYLFDWLRCPVPECRGELREDADEIVCMWNQVSHRYCTQEGLTLFAPNLSSGKYDKEFAAYYAGAMAYGSELLHLGASEGLYRTVMDLSTDLLSGMRSPLILDLGCGVGRITRDLARRSMDRMVVGLDASLPMLREAHRFTRTTAEISVDLSSRGFGRTGSTHAQRLNNVVLLQGDAAKTPFADAAFALVASVNLLDRVPDPMAVLREIYRILKPGGSCVLTSPLNWMPGDDYTRASELWNELPTRDQVLAAVKAASLHVDQWFDGLSYREQKDARGNTGEWSTLVIVCSRHNTL